MYVCMHEKLNMYIYVDICIKEIYIYIYIQI